MKLTAPWSSKVATPVLKQPLYIYLLLYISSGYATTIATRGGSGAQRCLLGPPLDFSHPGRSRRSCHVFKASRHGKSHCRTYVSKRGQRELCSITIPLIVYKFTCLIFLCLSFFLVLKLTRYVRWLQVTHFYYLYIYYTLITHLS